MERKCVRCSAGFVVEDWDQVFLRRLTLPEPVLCPPCRAQRRMAQLNQLHLFKTVCAATGQPIVSNYPPEGEHRVYAQPYWWSDEFDAAEYGRDFDFSRPFFPQLYELSVSVPRPALFTDYTRDENCSYTNHAGLNKNCYMLFDSDENRDCYYSYGMNSSRSCIDCYRVVQLELCAHAVDCTNCYSCAYISNCENCSDSAFLQNCIGCKHCIMCSNLRQKEYYYRNKPISPQHYSELRTALASAAAVARFAAEFEQYIKEFPQRVLRGHHNESVSGDYLVHCRNAHHCFDSMNIWDAKFCAQVFMGIKDSMDCQECGDAELLYDCATVGYRAHQVFFSHHCLKQVRDMFYCGYCFTGCSDLFGCIGLKRRKFCLLNKQLTSREYEHLLPRVIAHMKETGEWGSFMPMQLSPFPYNLTVAQQYYPLTHAAALEQGLSWREPETAAAEGGETAPETFAKINEQAIRNAVFGCSCGRRFKIIQQEFRLLQELALPPPASCFFCRHAARLAGRNPRQLTQRRCDGCAALMMTSFDSSRPEKVLCERCYGESLE